MPARLSVVIQVLLHSNADMYLLIKSIWHSPNSGNFGRGREDHIDTDVAWPLARC